MQIMLEIVTVGVLITFATITIIAAIYCIKENFKK